MEESKLYYLVIDFEANCATEGAKDYEIIEFPAILVEANTGKIINEFHTYVNLVKSEKLSEFIKDLTHITDEQVNSGKSWKECIIAFEQWCFENNINAVTTTVVTCGDWDLKYMLPRQLMITNTFFSPEISGLLIQWHNVKFSYRELMKQGGGMEKMLEGLKIKLVGHHHSGIDDSRNIVKICQELTKRGLDMTTPTSSDYPNYSNC